MFEFDSTRKTLTKCPQDVSGPVVIYEGVETIGPNAFKDCKEITSVVFPASLKTISSGAFSGCEKIITIYYAGTLEQWLNLDWDFYWKNGYQLYFRNELITDVVIPESITEIKPTAFYYCQSIKSVTFHNRVKKIGRDSFNKSGLNTGIHCPDSLEEIGKDAFFNSSIIGVKLNKNIKKIGEGAFSACYHLHVISIEQGATHYGCDQKRYLYEKTTRGDTLIAVAIDYFKSHKCCIPTHIIGIGEDCFCFETISKEGLIIDHHLSHVSPKAFRSANGGKIKVPIGKKQEAILLGIPQEKVEEHFCLEYAFLDGKDQIEAFVNNPFRVLGVDVAASMKIITANATKIKRYADVGKQVNFPGDRNEVLPPIVRTPEAVDHALAQINLPKDKIRYALLWFGDNEADLSDTEAEGWKEILNQVAHALLTKDVEEAIDKLTFFINGQKYEEDYNQFISEIGGENVDIDYDDVDHLFIDTLLESLNALSCHLLFKEYGYDSEIEYIGNKLYSTYEEKIKAQIAVADKVDEDDPEASLEAARNLINNAGLILTDFKNNIDDENNTRYSILADQLAERILQSSIDYYNKTIERRAALNTKELAEYALSIAVGQKQKDRCSEQLAVIKGIVDRQVPEDFWEEDDKMTEIIKRHRDKFEEAVGDDKDTDSNKLARIQKVYEYYTMTDDAIDLISDAYIIKVQILKKAGKETFVIAAKYLATLADRVANLAMQMSVYEYNLMNNLGKADIAFTQKTWSLMVALDKTLDITPDLRKKRLEPGMNTMRSNLLGLRQLPKDNNPVDKRTEDEIWIACKDLEKTKYYIRRFPDGKYINEAKKFIEKYVWAEAKKNNKPEDYLKDYPEGKYQLEALHLKDDLAWAKCKTTKQVLGYLNDFPHGAHVKQAEKRLVELEGDEKVWDAAVGNSKLCKEYLKQYPQGLHATEAAEYITEIKKQAGKLWFALALLLCITVAIVAFALEFETIGVGACVVIFIIFAGWLIQISF